MIRPALLACALYVGYALAHPEWPGARQPAAPALIAAGLLCLWLLNVLLDLGEGAFKLLLELAFLAGVAVLLEGMRRGRLPW